MGCWTWLKTQPLGLAFSVKTPRATPSVFWLQKPVPRAGFSAKPSTPWLKPITNEVFRIFALNCLHARHWVRVEYIVLYGVHVPIIVLCKGNGCSIRSKNGAVIRESLGQLATGRLTIQMENMTLSNNQNTYFSFGGIDTAPSMVYWLKYRFVCLKRQKGTYAFLLKTTFDIFEHIIREIFGKC